jgi:hypothetical protein
MARRYYANEAAPFDDKKANSYGKELARIQQEVGVLRPIHIVEAAQEEDSPLHERFTWDDPVAAQANRREQARRLVRQIEIQWKGQRVRAFETITLNVIRDDDPEGELIPVKVYLPQEDVRKDAGLHEQSLRDILRQLIHFKKRYGDVKVLGPVIEAIEQVEMKLHRAGQGL